MTRFADRGLVTEVVESEAVMARRPAPADLEDPSPDAEEARRPARESRS